METDLVGKVFGGLLEITLIPALLNESLDDLLVLFRCLILLGHRPPSFPAGIIDPAPWRLKRAKISFSC